MNILCSKLEGYTHSRCPLTPQSCGYEGSVRKLNVTKCNSNGNSRLSQWVTQGTHKSQSRALSLSPVLTLYHWAMAPITQLLAAHNPYVLVAPFFVMSISSRKCFNLFRWKQWKDLLQSGWPLLHYFMITNAVTTNFVVTNLFLIYKKDEIRK